MMGRRGPGKAIDPGAAGPNEVPSPPDWLGEIGRERWLVLAPVLAAKDRLRPEDVHLLAVYCQCFQTYREAIAKLSDGMTVELRSDSGDLKYIQTRPEVSIAQNAAEQMRKLSIEFGITPAARGRVPAPPPKQEDEVEDFSAGKPTLKPGKPAVKSKTHGSRDQKGNPKRGR